MPGPPPNPNARRRNSGSGFTDLPASGWDEPPELPTRREKGKRWLKSTQDAWEVWWRSPMASQWTVADLPTVVLAAMAYDDGMRGSLDSAKEFRLLADRLGLHSLARLRNRWSLPSEDAADESDSTVVRLVAVGE